MPAVIVPMPARSRSCNTSLVLFGGLVLGLLSAANEIAFRAGLWCARLPPPSGQACLAPPMEMKIDYGPCCRVSTCPKARRS
jgi:hypothetical protein